MSSTSLLLLAANISPVAAVFKSVADEAGIDADATVEIDVLAGDQGINFNIYQLITNDGNGNNTVASVSFDGAAGAVTYSPDGQFDLAAGATATDAFRYKVYEAAAPTQYKATTVSVTITGVDTAGDVLNAADDKVGVEASSGYVVVDVLANDSGSALLIEKIMKKDGSGN